LPRTVLSTHWASRRRLKAKLASGQRKSGSLSGRRSKALSALTDDVGAI
jgi:hypothetical protein